jgi:hypothetical protein
VTNGTRSVPTRRRAILAIAPASVVLMAGVAIFVMSRRTDGGAGAVADGAAAPGGIDWETTSEGDFESRHADTSGSRIVLRAATRGTVADTVKFLGVRRRKEIRLTPGARIAVDLDWNRQANGSGLSAGLVLSPEATQGNPLANASAFWVEFIGVPPGRNARRVIGLRSDSQSRTLDKEGWPEENREGREIGVQRIEIEIGEKKEIRVLENGVPVYSSAPDALGFDRGYLYLQISSRANYPPREVAFVPISVRSGGR